MKKLLSFICTLFCLSCFFWGQSNYCPSQFLPPFCIFIGVFVGIPVYGWFMAEIFNIKL